MPLWERHCWQTRANLCREREKDRAEAPYQRRWSLILPTRKTLLADHHPQSKSEAALGVHASGLTGFHAWHHKDNIKRVLKRAVYLFWGPSPTRYSITLSRAPLSLGSTGLARGGPGGCVPNKPQCQYQLNMLSGPEHTAGAAHR